MRKARAFLDHGVADESETPALRENGCFVLDRAVAEMEDETARDAIPARGLDQITGRNNDAGDGARTRAFAFASAFGGPKHEKTPDEAFGVAHGDRLRQKRAGAEDGEDACEEDATVHREYVSATTLPNRIIASASPAASGRIVLRTLDFPDG
jgi:hypothetical protein